MGLYGPRDLSISKKGRYPERGSGKDVQRESGRYILTIFLQRKGERHASRWASFGDQKRDQQGFPASLPGARCRRNRSLKRETKHKARVSSLVSQGLLFLAHLVVSGPGCFPRLALALALAFSLDLSHVEAIAGDRGRVERKRRSKSGKNDQRYVTAPHGPQSINSGIDQSNHSRLHPIRTTLRPDRRRKLYRLQLPGWLQHGPVYSITADRDREISGSELTFESQDPTTCTHDETQIRTTRSRRSPSFDLELTQISQGTPQRTSYFFLNLFSDHRDPADSMLNSRISALEPLHDIRSFPTLHLQQQLLHLFQVVKDPIDFLIDDSCA